MTLEPASGVTFGRGVAPLRQELGRLRHERRMSALTPGLARN